ncbi:hypothetical protein [Sphingomonas sp. PAMC 26605]|uniref:hypothetical protein n=1 Tax=Sphingomonas sp. PAMC 26605 TaxID=1112214 RepID=UPI00055F62A1|nr:hypothetical protein [Sphingomonas sp. PAMC 26605]
MEPGTAIIGGKQTWSMLDGGMAFRPETETQKALSSEIGLMRYEAICHFLIDGDYKADHQNDFAGAYLEYANAWSMLVTAKARQLSGLGLLNTIADFAARSGDSKLIAEANELVVAFREETEEQ